MSNATVEEGWYPDPLNPTKIRYWDGFAWTVYSTSVEHVHHSPGVNGEVTVDYSTVEMLRSEIASAENELALIRQELALNADLFLFDSVQLSEASASPLNDSIVYKQKLETLKAEGKELVRQKMAYTCVTQWTINNSAKEGQKMADGIGKLALRAYNTEIDNLLQKVRPFKSEESVERASKAKTAIEKLSAVVHVEIKERFHRIRCEELRLMALFREAQEEEKEKAREERERLREEKRVEEELLRERKKLEEELQKTEIALATAVASGDTEAVALLEARVAEEQEELALVEHRRANLKSGSIYVISNIGAFGENIVKIGMTRRADPQERVKELSGASVPFIFDVHALFFADNAADIEAKLHRIFAKRKVNQVNARKQFFYATPREVLEVIRQLAIPVVEFQEYPAADQFRASQKLVDMAAPLESQLIAKLAKDIDVSTVQLISKLKNDRVTRSDAANKVGVTLPSSAPVAQIEDTLPLSPAAPASTPVAVPVAVWPQPKLEAPAPVQMTVTLKPKASPASKAASEAISPTASPAQPLTRRQLREAEALRAAKEE